MPIRIGIYDFFAYTIPGVFYLFTIAYLCTTLGFLTIDLQSLNDLSVVQAVIAAVLAYTLGLILDPIAGLWHQLFKTKSASKAVLDNFKERRPYLEINFQPSDWAILLMYTRRQSTDMAYDIERPNVTRIMLRNISLSLMILSVIQAAHLIHSRFFVRDLISTIALAAASTIAGMQGAKFNRWFYSAIYESAVAHTLDPARLVTWKQMTQPEKIEPAGETNTGDKGHATKRPDPDDPRHNP